MASDLLITPMKCNLHKSPEMSGFRELSGWWRCWEGGPSREEGREAPRPSPHTVAPACVPCGYNKLVIISKVLS